MNYHIMVRGQKVVTISTYRVNIFNKLYFVKNLRRMQRQSKNIGIFILGAIRNCGLLLPPPQTPAALPMALTTSQ